MRSSSIKPHRDGSDDGAILWTNLHSLTTCSKPPSKDTCVDRRSCDHIVVLKRRINFYFLAALRINQILTSSVATVMRGPKKLVSPCFRLTSPSSLLRMTGLKEANSLLDQNSFKLSQSFSECLQNAFRILLKIMKLRHRNHSIIIKFF